MITGHSGCPSMTELMRRQPRPTVVYRKRLCTTSVSGPTCTLVSVTRLTTYLPILDASSTNVSQWYPASAAMSQEVMPHLESAPHLYGARDRPYSGGAHDGRCEGVAGHCSTA